MFKQVPLFHDFSSLVLNICNTTQYLFWKLENIVSYHLKIRMGMKDQLGCIYVIKNTLPFNEIKTKHKTV